MPSTPSSTLVPNRGKPIEPLRTSHAFVQQIRDRFAAEQANPKRATQKGELPENYEAITPEWLTANLAGDVAGAEVVSMHLGPKDNGTANRRHVYMEWNEAGQKAGLPTSMFCKATHSVENRINMSFGGVDSEVAWFNHLQPKCGFITPVAYFSFYDPETLNSISALHDLTGKVEFLNILRNKYTKDMVQQQLAILAKLHGKNWLSQDKDVLDRISFRQGFNGLDVSTKVEEACNNGFAAAKDVIPPRLFAREKEVWDATVISVERNYQYPYTLTHNDCHPGNFFRLPDGTIGVQDFQCVARGHWARDFAYCLGTSSTVEDRRLWQDSLMDYYLAELHANGGPKLDLKHAWDEVRLQSFAALAYWTLTLTPTPDYMPSMQTDAVSLATIERQAAFMDDIDAFSAVPLGIYVD